MDREKIIKELKRCVLVTTKEYGKPEYVEIPYELYKDVLALLKEKETANIYKCQNCGTWVSAENVVRCKDCKHCDLPEEKPYENGYCSRCGYVTMNWFCADGVRRE